MTNSAVARVERVTHRYGKTFALNNLTLDIPAQCMAGLIGPDGVGKSTLLALISGVRKIQTGKVIVLDGSMADEHHRRASYGRIAYMPQGLGRNLYPTLSVFDNIDFFGRLFGQGAAERRARIEELLKATALDPFANRPCGKLSGGMKQKASLCCSLMHDPDLLVLDEPTTGVDPLSRRQFWELIDTIGLIYVNAHRTTLSRKRSADMEASSCPQRACIPCARHMHDASLTKLAPGSRSGSSLPPRISAPWPHRQRFRS